MRTAVLDASVVLKWFAAGEELGAAEARDLRLQFERGELVAMVPPLLDLEILNVAGRSWHWPPGAMTELAQALEGLGLERIMPPLATVADWVGSGLTAYDAEYVAVAQATSKALITADEVILRIAAGVAESLVSA